MILRVFRILVGSILVVFPFLMGSWAYLFFKKEGDGASYMEDVLKPSFWLLSGRWDKLPE